MDWNEEDVAARCNKFMRDENVVSLTFCSVSSIDNLSLNYSVPWDDESLNRHEKSSTISKTDGRSQNAVLT